jgi:hypothetical protein
MKDSIKCNDPNRMFRLSFRTEDIEQVLCLIFYEIKLLCEKNQFDFLQEKYYNLILKGH